MSRRISFEHPYTGHTLDIQAEPESEWQRLCEQLGWQQL
jgi:hypothetical protein